MDFLAKLMGKETSRSPRARERQPVSLYRCVRIVADGAGCCLTASLIAGQRFLTDEIPKLPLEECDVSECRCSYRLYDDRRTSERHLSDFGYDMISEMHTDDSQRGSGGDRRGERGGKTAFTGA